MEIYTLNLEKGMPSVDTARMNLDQGIRTAKARGVKIVKLIHGYGSSGKGGLIKRDVRTVLQEYKRTGRIKEFVGGEDFSPFNAQTRKIIDACPQAAKDRDCALANHGITVVLL